MPYISKYTGEQMESILDNSITATRETVKAISDAKDATHEADKAAKTAKVNGDYALAQAQATEAKLKTIPTLEYNSEDGCLYAITE